MTRTAYPTCSLVHPVCQSVMSTCRMEARTLAIPVSSASLHIPHELLTSISPPDLPSTVKSGEQCSNKLRVEDSMSDNRNVFRRCGFTVAFLQERLNILGDSVHQSRLIDQPAGTHTSLALFLTSSADSAPSYFSVRVCIGSNFPRAPPHDLPSATPKCCSRNCRSTVSGGLGSGWYWWIWSAWVSAFDSSLS